MKRMLLLLVALMSTQFLVAEENSEKPWFIDGGFGLSFGAMNSSDPLIQTAGFLLSIRGGGDFAVQKQLVGDWISAGGQLGVYYISFDNVLLLDVPIRAVAKIGQGATFIQPFAGYYLPLTGWSALGGLEFGAKVSLGGLFFEFSSISSQVPWTRYNVGFLASEVFRF
jgi:hypothetical protein